MEPTTINNLVIPSVFCGTITARGDIEKRGIPVDETEEKCPKSVASKKSGLVEIKIVSGGNPTRIYL